MIFWTLVFVFLAVCCTSCVQLREVTGAMNGEQKAAILNPEVGKCAGFCCMAKIDVRSSS